MRKVKFRNLFKLAICARDREENAEALRLFEECVDLLRLKQEIDFLDPLELEYLFKTYTQECYIYYKIKQHRKALKRGEQALGIWKEGIFRSRFFDVFYGEGEAEKYRSTLQKMLDPKAAYAILAECYSELANPEKAREYRNLSEARKEIAKVG